MTAEALKTIVDGLNAEPFNMNLNLISFDSMSSGRLIQVLSDVIGWIENDETIDIREEAPDQTALRIFNSLRILKYRPPNDIEQLDKKLTTKKKKKTSLPKQASCQKIDRRFRSLKQGTKRLSLRASFKRNKLIDTMEMFLSLKKNSLTSTCFYREIHSQVIETRKDTLLAEDIRNDLKTMDHEKEQLNRRIEKIERKLRTVANVEHYMELAAKCRAENEKQEKIALHRQEQRNALVHNEQRLQRLNATLKEIIAAADNTDPTEAMNRLKEEVETTRYMVEEKLPKEIEAKRAIVAELSKVADMPAIDKNDIAEIQQKIDATNKEIVEMISERDKRDEATDKLSIYRHQATAIARKKAALAEKLQELRTELQNIESMVEVKKKELREKSGGEDVITSVQEMNGGRVIEWNSSKQYERPKTAKPSSDDVNELRQMVKELNTKLEQKRTIVGELTEDSNRLSAEFAELNERYGIKKRNYEMAAASLENEFSRLQEFKNYVNKLRTKTTAYKRKRAEIDDLKSEFAILARTQDILNGQWKTLKEQIEVKTMEEQLANYQWKRFRAEMELKIVNCIVERLEAEERGEERKMVELIEEEINHANDEAETLRRSSQSTLDRSPEEAAEQVRMWRSLIKIFSLKLKTAHTTANPEESNEQMLSRETPIGDRSPVPSRPFSGRRSAVPPVNRP
ncbi:Intraflagellar transport protein 81 -like protein [Toxocara canis]|uniref:Intraflagellar transport protein 81-like protein n=1 Tax=Toxocara canis TaxID=6265 RepID=A0A0B2UTX4_TOXCA|nr:Intraflagellar transport protein 81 -like protein [Toxocara canis]